MNYATEREISMGNDWEKVKATFLENWPAALKLLSIDQVDVPLTLAETAALGSTIRELSLIHI